MKKWMILLLLCVMLAGCAQAGPASTAPEELTEDFLRQVRQDYLDTTQFPSCSCQLEDVNLIIVSRVESGYALFIGCNCSSFRTDKAWLELAGESAGDLSFYMPTGWYLMFYRNGEFKPMASAYNSQWLSYGELRTIWDEYHAQYPKALERWKLVHPGLSQPPQRDPSGLDYEVNADGKTCTVTGPGVFVGTELVIPEYIGGYQVTKIGDCAFQIDLKITNIVLPDSVTVIDSYAFERCYELRAIQLGSGLKAIGQQAFADCEKLEAVHIPESVISIGGGAFSGCKSLTSFAIPSGVTSIGAGTFSGCKKLATITIPQGVRSIGREAFSGCTSLVELDLPQSITVLGEGTFRSCTSLRTITIPESVTKLDNYLFDGCNALETVHLPEGLVEIGSFVFDGCKSLTQLVIPDGVTEIEGSAYMGCTGLQSVTIGAGVKVIHVETFKEWWGVTEIFVSEKNPYFHVTDQCLIETETKTLLFGSANAKIPADGSVLTIGRYAFYGREYLTELVIPEGVQVIEGTAFKECKNLRRVTLPQSIRTLGTPFGDCHALTDIYYEGTLKQWEAIRKSNYLRGDGVSLTVHCTDGKIEDMR